MNVEERVCQFDCLGDRLVGILSLPTTTEITRAIVMLVGGTQYRTGSHRQFTLLARHFAASGIAVLRFDRRGTGDSEGQPRDFEHASDDIRSAIDALLPAVPQLRELVLWGLCDGASAALLYSRSDRRVTGLCLVKPWARTDAGLAQAYLKHYYLPRLLSKALWRKILHRQFDLPAALTSLAQQLRQALSGRAASMPTSTPTTASLPHRLRQAYQEFTGSVQLILCGNDLTAQEFADLARADQEWHALLHDQRSTVVELADANHTFSTRIWREQVAQATIQWMIPGAPSVRPD